VAGSKIKPSDFWKIGLELLAIHWQYAIADRWFPSDAATINSSVGLNSAVFIFSGIRTAKILEPVNASRTLMNR
jgi:hypothetical protein